MYKLVKRFFDIFVSIFALFLILPFLIMIYILSLFYQGLPVFFVHERLGINGRPFKMVKFRSMTVGPSISAKDDEKRLTKFGRFLRRTSIDELPVLINVIKGDMSLVGPRPMPLKYLFRFNNNQKRRMYIKPGITGLAQINGRNKLTWEEKFNFDVEYVFNHSFKLDILILLKTFIVVFNKADINSEKNEIMPEFMGDSNGNHQ